MTSLTPWRIPIPRNRPRRRLAVHLGAFVWVLGGVLGGVLGLIPGPASADDIIGETALLQGLDKVTARISTFEAPIDRVVLFGTLEIVARACHKRPPEEEPESAAFLHIRDAKPGQVAVTLFQGWMFASSPALSALEHPVYDVWVVDCLKEGGP